jgi:hypothetical protein
LQQSQQSGEGAPSFYGAVLGPIGFDEPETDVVQPICHFRQLHIGDWLIWADMGAYTLNNVASLEDEEFDGESRPSSPSIFYFSSRKNW